MYTFITLILPFFYRKIRKKKRPLEKNNPEGKNPIVVIHFNVVIGNAPLTVCLTLAAANLRKDCSLVANSPSTDHSEWFEYSRNSQSVMLVSYKTDVHSRSHGI